MTATLARPPRPALDALLDRLAGERTPLSAALAAFERGIRAVALHETIPAARPALLAALYRARRRPTLAILPTPDAAERAYADLLCYLGEAHAGDLFLHRGREAAFGSIESPAERSARITLLAALDSDAPLLVLTSVAALRSYVMPRALLRELRSELRVGGEPGWEATIRNLHRLGYERTDIVGAVGQYAVRGGILDLYAATAESPTRVEFFGDTIESIRSFEIESQRSVAPLDALDLLPWGEIPRDESYRRSVAERIGGDGPRERAVRAFLDRGEDLPDAWIAFAYERPATIFDYLPADALLALVEPATLAAIESALDDERIRARSTLLADAAAEELDVRDEFVDDALLAEIEAPHPRLDALGEACARLQSLVLPGAIEGLAPAWLPRVDTSFVLETRPSEHYNRQMTLFLEAVRESLARRESIVILTSGVARVGEIFSAAGIDVLPISRALADGGICIEHGSIDGGFTLPDARLRILGDREIFGAPPKRVKLRAVKEGVPVTLADLKVGDFVVHAVHGIGQYVGLRSETLFGVTQDFLDLHYAGSDRMMVPVTQMHQVTKYAAGDGATPRLSKMGGVEWARTKARVGSQLAAIADGLVELYAEREMSRGFSFSPDSAWQSELEEAFPYDLTPDQATAVTAVKGDMERARPMDRVVCGDVGYGKTEVALRAAFKAVSDKKQVAILVPTTLLAAQHYRTFSTRFAAYPLRVEELSRFKTKAEQRAVLAALAEGKVDIVIGTHRLLQKDVVFADLGLIVVDEEQRFGVMHKERLKELKTSVDVLTLSATPIPRTLHMSLMGVRDLSLIQTAPKNRMSIKTVVLPGGDAVVTRAISAELDRGGQIYYLHNRVESIHAVANALQQLVPRARIAIGHGQMTEGELEPVMQKFIDGETDVLVATTIIENGIDIPNVNTMIVADADRFGLAQLYQLRGRVGRSNHQAYCYLLYQGHKVLTEDAKARLEAIREFTHLGSGLQIAMRDLEIRGAGNLVGAAQSGFIASVGFDTYCQLLADAIAARRGTAATMEERQEAVIDVKVSAFVPDDYVPQVSQKIAIYQQLARARSESDVEEIAAGVRDRFGPLPRPLETLVEITKLRAIALAKHVTRVVVDERRLTLGVGTGFALAPAGIPQLQSLTKNRFRFAEGKILVDLPPAQEGASERRWMPLLRGILEAL